MMILFLTLFTLKRRGFRRDGANVFVGERLQPVLSYALLFSGATREGAKVASAALAGHLQNLLKYASVQTSFGVDL